MTTSTLKQKKPGIFSFIKQAVTGTHQDFTTGSIRRAVFLLAIPMMLEMIMESVFAVVDIFFVSKLGNEAIATVGLTESVLTLVYSIAIGLSMAATATVARRIGEKDQEAAAKAGMQATILAIALTVVISILGVVFAPNILRIMGASEHLIATGVNYTRIIFAGSIVIMLLFLINGIFRGAGDASVAMKSLWIANICNIILCPVLINGWGPFPELGLTGAALATTIGRGIGVIYQVYRLFSGKGILKIRLQHFIPDLSLIKNLFNIAWTGTVQFLIGSASWIALTRIIAHFHEDAMAGYQVAIRIIMFFLLPAWGFSNAAATLVGQNLGAKQPERAERSVITTAKYNAIFMACVTLFFLLFAENVVGFMNLKGAALEYSTEALKTIALGYIFYGVGMVMMNAFNGAGDTKTPTWMNLFVFWAFQIPLAYLLAFTFKMGPSGVFTAILISHMAEAVAGVILFKKGRWKKVVI
jgi:putative MATE family efflux protein